MSLKVTEKECIKKTNIKFLQKICTICLIFNILMVLGLSFLKILTDQFLNDFSYIKYVKFIFNALIFRYMFRKLLRGCFAVHVMQVIFSDCTLWQVKQEHLPR
ncbi:MAG: hypothetical protein EAZ57_08405 [Cytophagales bacterium]|nr:MAG: hypothetical protein EAZ67_05775 [Cytophagales bacterium]TAF60168.1 MAG: hypothetical protein EAZ57_08405 [Cytophagales bacterium]